MNYKETTSWMFSKLPMYQSHGKSAYKEDLHRTELLVSHLKNPHHNFKSVHVGGTNGKGSTCHIISSILQEHNFTVGLLENPSGVNTKAPCALFVTVNSLTAVPGLPLTCTGLGPAVNQ